MCVWHLKTTNRTITVMHTDKCWLFLCHVLTFVGDGFSFFSSHWTLRTKVILFFMFFFIQTPVSSFPMKLLSCLLFSVCFGLSFNTSSPFISCLIPSYLLLPSDIKYSPRNICLFFHFSPPSFLLFYNDPLLAHMEHSGGNVNEDICLNNLCKQGQNI